MTTRLLFNKLFKTGTPWLAAGLLLWTAFAGSLPVSAEAPVPGCDGLSCGEIATPLTIHPADVKTPAAGNATAAEALKSASPSGAPLAPSSQAASSQAAPPQAAPIDYRLAETLTVSFRKQFQAVLDEAQKYLTTHRARNAAVVLDLDETLLDNRGYFMVFKRYDPELWNQWVAKQEAPAIPETVEFVRWLNKKRFHIYFVSGRKEFQRGETAANLKSAGITRYDGMYLKPDNYNADSAADFKVEARKAIEAKGQPVLLILGDQESDLRGGLGQGFKLPNPIYTIP